MLQEGDLFVGQWSSVGRQTEQSFIGFLQGDLFYSLGENYYDMYLTEL